MSDKLEAQIKFLDWINAMILLPDKPQPGDFIALDTNGYHPDDFNQNISWYCSQVLEVNGSSYKVSYNDKWYTFKEFDVPWPDKNGLSNVYQALPEC